LAKPKGSSKENKKEKESFWGTFPGIVTAIAALVTAFAVLLGALNTVGMINTSSMNPTATSTTLPVAPSTATFTTTPTANAQEVSGEFDHLIYEEDFEDQIADEIETIYGHFDIVQTSDGNHVWRTEDNATSQLILPTESNDYAVQARIMQVDGDDTGQGTFWLRRKNEDSGCPAYLVYMVVLYDQVRLIEKGPDPDCPELQETGLYEDYYFEDSDGLANGMWYTVRIELKGAAVRVYWDGKLILEDEDTDGDVRQSNVIGFAACCGNENTHTFDFDDIRVWINDP
jgi:hypothetical protein